MDEIKKITETEADLMVERVLMTNRIFCLVIELEKAIWTYTTPMLDRETARKFRNYSNYLEKMHKEVKKEFQNAFIDLKAEMNFDRAKS